MNQELSRDGNEKKWSKQGAGSRLRKNVRAIVLAVGTALVMGVAFGVGVSNGSVPRDGMWRVLVSAVLSAALYGVFVWGMWELAERLVKKWKG